MQQRSNNTRLRAGKQVADDSGEDDWEYFAARPAAESRVRLPFDDEFPRSVIGQALARKIFVHVYMIRDASGAPLHRARGIFYADCGGNA